MQVGLDIGAVSAKLVIILQENDSVIAEPYNSQLETINYNGKTLKIYYSEPLRTFGNVIESAESLLNHPLLKNASFNLGITGSQGKLAAHVFQAPYINEFKAIATGVYAMHPEVKSIIEIGGDKSRYMRVRSDSGMVSILDFERNGDCAAGTGSFIDQQAERLGIPVEKIGEMVLQSDTNANIAGRCSVFAKSDMIHAQQRGFSPEAVFKGLCQAVVRNYKGTVTRGKTLEPEIVFVGGLAMNAGVVQAVKDSFALERLIVPEHPMHSGAVGCALATDSAPVSLDNLKKIKTTGTNVARTRTLNISKAIINDDAAFTRQLQSGETCQAWLGLDVGSVSTNLVLLDMDNRVIDSVYTRTEGKPIIVVRREMREWARKWGDRLQIMGVGTTGSGRELAGELTGADMVRDEITAHKTGACSISRSLGLGDVDTIFEIGGQDSKFISIQDGIVIDFTMNEACAAGTGSFLEEQASRMGIAIKEEFSKLALGSTQPIKMGERCTVFMEKDVSAFLQQGTDKADLAAGLAYAVVHNYLNRVVRDRKIGNVIFFQGGTAYNRSVAAAFSTILDKKIIVPPFNGVMGAIGAALLAREHIEQTDASTRFRGFDLDSVKFSVRNIRCKGCSNQCDVQECTVEGEKTYWGDKCSNRFRKKPKTALKPVIPNLINMYNELLLNDIPGPDGLGVKIGMPRSMYYYDSFPFWKTYFGYLGAEIVLSDTTNKKIVKQGRELTVADPCFPIIVAHGHILDLATKNVDYIFTPNVVNAETNFPDTQSWYCPWGQTLPYVVRPSLTDPALLEKLLIPVIRYRNGIDYIKKTLRPFAKQLGASAKTSDKAIDMAYAAKHDFTARIKSAGQSAIKQLLAEDRPGVALLGRPYNIYDSGINLNVPEKLREQFGANILPLDFIPSDHIDVTPVHENMFWNYGRKILQTAMWAGKHPNLSVIYLTNFKCGPDSYIKHFVGNALGSPFLILQFDEHSNDAGVMTRCEAFLASKGMLNPALQPSVSEQIEIS